MTISHPGGNGIALADSTARSTSSSLISSAGTRDGDNSVLVLAAKMLARQIDDGRVDLEPATRSASPTARRIDSATDLRRRDNASAKPFRIGLADADYIHPPVSRRLADDAPDACSCRRLIRLLVSHLSCLVLIYANVIDDRINASGVDGPDLLALSRQWPRSPIFKLFAKLSRASVMGMSLPESWTVAFGSCRSETSTCFT